MFVVVPIRDDIGKVVAALAVRIDPFLDFTHITQIARTGKTGDSYAFNRSARLITGSRFDAQLRQVGLLDADQCSILALDLRDPGGNMLDGFRPEKPRRQLPLTHMADSAVRGNSGVNIKGYRDYRGVEVMGAWLWDI